MKVLIAYGTTEGHTRKIAVRMGEWAREKGYEPTVMDCANMPASLDVDQFEAVVLAGSLHAEKHQSSLTHFIQDNRIKLQRVPSAFVSVSLTAIETDEASLAEARRCIDELTTDTGWIPTISTPVAGALLYTKYDFIKRQLLKYIAKKHGGPTDVHQDYEFTDWDALKTFLGLFLEKYVPLKSHAVVNS